MPESDPPGRSDREEQGVVEEHGGGEVDAEGSCLGAVVLPRSPPPKRLITLMRNGRLRRGDHDRRLALLIRRFSD